MPETITINKDNAHFFIAICEQEKHSFLMLGLYDQHRVTQMLCRVGKVFNVNYEENEYGEEGCFQTTKRLSAAVFSAAPSIIEDEGIDRMYKGEKSISYQAYTINYQQYIEFVRMLEGLQTDTNTYECFKPVQEREIK